MRQTITRNSEIITVSKAKMTEFILVSWYLMQLMPFERLEPYEVKVSCTVLRRGRSREASSLSDNGMNKKIKKQKLRRKR